MADALCGPSNALQNFQKHTSVDRTLQQDRLATRQSPTQGFRSQNSNAGILDPEFEAFEANIAGPPPNLQYAVPFSTPDRQVSMFSPKESSDWATDFQKLQLSGPSHPVAQPLYRTEAPLSRVSHGGWHEESTRQQQNIPVHQQQPSHVATFQPSFSYPMTGVMNSFPPQQEAAQNQSRSETETFDESAFEAAFAQARAEADMQESSTIREAAGITRASQVDSVLTTQAPEQIRIGSDTIPYVEKTGIDSHGDDPDELAKTAGQLLDSVSHDQSQKFKESNFLALMRRIRDREVRVEGDQFRDTVQPLHPGGKYYPADYRQSPNFEAEMTGPIITTNDISKFDDIEESGTLRSRSHASASVHR